MGWSLEKLVGLLEANINQVGVMKVKAAFKSILAGVISAVLSDRALNLPAILCALALRRKMPDAWFSGLIVWYATFAVSEFQ
jgi:hypothetical protein